MGVGDNEDEIAGVDVGAITTTDVGNADVGVGLGAWASTSKEPVGVTVAPASGVTEAPGVTEMEGDGEIDALKVGERPVVGDGADSSLNNEASSLKPTGDASVMVGAGVRSKNGAVSTSSMGAS